MKIGLFQYQSHGGDISKNIGGHLHWVEKAVSYGADIVVFPELSITGYEPSLAKTLALEVNDTRLSHLQSSADKNKIIIGIGAPIKESQDIYIGMILFHPNEERQIYYKKYLHEDEEPFFKCGKESTPLIRNTQISLAICYELSVPEHRARVIDLNTEIYIASVAKTKEGVKSASKRLAEIARSNSIPTLMCNSTGPSEGFIGAGQSAIWDRNGELMTQLDATTEDMIVYDSTLKTH